MKWQKIRLPWKNLICLGLMLVSMLGIMMIQWNEINTFRMVNNDSLHYVRGYVESVDSEQLEPDTLADSKALGGDRAGKDRKRNQLCDPNAERGGKAGHDHHDLRGSAGKCRTVLHSV